MRRLRLTNPKNNPEQVLKRAICQWLSYHQRHCMFWVQSTVGIWDPKLKIYRKNNSPYQRNGIADILGIWRGRPLAIEVKWGKNVPSTEQMEFLEEFRGKGGIAIVAYSLDEVIATLNQEDKK